MTTTTPTPRSFAQKLRAELDGRKMSVRALARRIDAGNVEQARRTVHRWLNGTTPTQPNRDLVTDVLGMERGSLDPDPDEEEDPAVAAVRQHVDGLVGALLDAVRQVQP